MGRSVRSVTNYEETKIQADEPPSCYMHVMNFMNVYEQFWYQK